MAMTKLITHEQMADILTQIAIKTGVEIPTTERNVLFFTRRIIETAIANRKKAVRFDRLAEELKEVVNC